jgi:DNA adenine methylase
MAVILARLKAGFIFSINDVPEMRKTFSGFNVKPVSLKYSVAVGKCQTGKELLISNF